jgi:Flp pilus assembly protein TadD
MTSMRIDHTVGRGTDAAPGRRIPWALLNRNPTDVIFARKALDQEQFEDAERHLRKALDFDPESADARSLTGVLHERLGEHHTAYQYSDVPPPGRRETVKH